LIASDEQKKADMMEVYECSKCEEWFAEKLTVILVHRYDTARLQNGESFIIEYKDKVPVCPECHGAYMEVDTKVGFKADA
jgi:Zn finger protein HypA/HybF involved in hydrogenase expression